MTRQQLHEDYWSALLLYVDSLFPADEYIYCSDCGQPFLFSADMKKYYAEHRLHRPKRCKDCRTVRRTQVLTDDEIADILYFDEVQPYRYAPSSE